MGQTPEEREREIHRELDNIRGDVIDQLTHAESLLTQLRRLRQRIDVIDTRHTEVARENVKLRLRVAELEAKLKAGGDAAPPAADTPPGGTAERQQGGP